MKTSLCDECEQRLQIALAAGADPSDLDRGDYFFDVECAWDELRDTPSPGDCFEVVHYRCRKCGTGWSVASRTISGKKTAVVTPTGTMTQPMMIR